jgi:23S rRNA-/tRNA-specific pseudouridylate synthase
MRSRLSVMLAEIFLHDLEQQRIKHLLENGNIIYYNRYVKDIIIVYNHTKINPQIISEQFNVQRKDLQFTINDELEIK